MDILPQEIQLKIVSYLEYSDLVAYSQTCSNAYTLYNDNHL